MSYDDDELKEVKQQVDKRLWRLGLLGAHFVAWVAGSAVLAAALGEEGALIVPIWFGVVVLHGLYYFLSEKREHDIQAELERREQLRGNDKLKRDRLYRLSDDGELVEVEDDEHDEVLKEKQHI
jgi:uncharacterized membrane protein YfcA